MNFTGKDPLLRKLELRNWFLLGAMLLLSFPFTGYNFLLGLFIGGLISIANFYWMGRDLRSAFQKLSDHLKVFVLFKFYIRLGITAVVLYLIISRTPADIFGLLIGLSVVIVNIVFSTVMEYQKKIPIEEVRQ
ncbi:MAG: putative rane protein [Deltaproteobacteria bacterium]|jgi:hypothetical protein|nr:putative rane protein [Deltaproteobacteria bacterium]